MVETRYTMN